MSKGSGLTRTETRRPLGRVRQRFLASQSIIKALVMVASIVSYANAGAEVALKRVDQLWLDHLTSKTLVVIVASKEESDATVNTPPAAPSDSESVRTQLLDQLHAKLAQTEIAAEAAMLARQIWAVWLHHADPVINDLMQQVLAARRAGRWQHAHDLTDIIIRRQPDYAEGWNQRATVRFVMGQYEASLEDVAQTLELEPRHFGALSGRGMIRLKQGKDALAWQNFEAARRLHPFVIERSLIPPSARETDT